LGCIGWPGWRILSGMEDHYWDHLQARWVHYVATEVPEQRDPAAQPPAEVVSAGADEPSAVVS
jgi:hypothetical protein